MKWSQYSHQLTVDGGKLSPQEYLNFYVNSLISPGAEILSKKGVYVLSLSKPT